MTQTDGFGIKSESNLRITIWGNYLFLNRKKDNDCDNCGKTITKRYRVVSGVVVEGKPNTIISYVCRRCY